MPGWLNRLLLRIGRTRTGADVEDELRVHLQMAAEDHAALGLPAIEAQRRARLSLGSPLAMAEQIADQELMTWFEGCYHDFVLGCRAVKKTPLFSLTSILTLALGIGANTATFSLLYGLFLRSLPAENARSLVSVGITTGSPDDDSNSIIPYRLAEAFQGRQRSLSAISFWDFGTVSTTDRDGTLRLFNAGLVSGNAFPLLGLKPSLGRSILPSENQPRAFAGTWPVVLSYRFWTDRFAADRAVIGKRLQICGQPATVVGVAPPRFDGPWPGMELKLYLPLRFVSVMAAREFLDNPQIFYWCSAIGRLRPGVTLQAANADAESLRKDLFREFIPARFQHLPVVRQAKLRLRSARNGLPSAISGRYTEPLLILQGLVLVVLLLCCINVGGLMMSRVHARRREFAVRTAIGAARRRLIRQYLTESFVIALAGSALGGIAAWFGSPALLRFLRDPTMFESVSVQPDSMVFWITALTAITTTISFGVFPALRASRSDNGLLLNARAAYSPPDQRAARAFIPLQVGLSLVLVAVAALLSQSLILIGAQHRGFDVDHVTIQTPPFHRLPQKGSAKLDVYQKMIDRIQQLPGIRSAAVTWFTPMSGQQARARFVAANKSTNSFKSESLAYNLVGPGYFHTMETNLLAGREFRRSERRLDVCVLNRSAALKLFSHQAALGNYVQNEISDGLGIRSSCRVIGIAEDAKFASLREPAPPTIYYPIVPEDGGTVTNLVFLMNAGTKKQAIDAYRKALAEIAPSIPLVLFVTLREQMDAALGGQRLITMLSNSFAGLALFLSAIGLYGTLSSNVAQRAGEIGIRIALGAQRGRVVRLILSEAVSLLGFGILLGAAGLFLSGRFIAKMLFGVSTFEPAVLIGTLALLVTVGLLAASAPAVRAASIDPLRALRTN